MLHPVYVHPGDETHAHGVTLPEPLPNRIQSFWSMSCA